MLQPPKTSIFDLTLPGTSAVEPQVAPVPEVPADAFQTAKVPLPPLPKTSIFDITQTGIPAPAPVVVGVPEASPEAFQTAKVPIPELPKVSIFDITQAGVPAVAPAPGPVSDATEVEPWDEGTAAEWNPRWNPKPVAVQAMEPAAPKPHRWGIFVAAGILGSAALVVMAVLYFRTTSPTLAMPRPKPIPEGLLPYQAKAEAGDPAAMRMLGLCYCYGIAAPADWQEGTLWLRRAAQAGNGTARTELISMGLRPE